MKRTDLIQFIESVKAGKIQLNSNIWKLETGSYYRWTGEAWELTPNPVFSKLDTMICDDEPKSFSGNIIVVGKPENRRQLLIECGMLTDEEIELQIQKASTVKEVAQNIVLMIKKFENEK